MKMGVERVLRENFPNLTSVEAVSPAPAVALLDKEKVAEALGPVMSAITSMGGRFDVRQVYPEGKIVIAFAGPARLKQGINLILKDLDGVQEVVFEDLLPA